MMLNVILIVLAGVFLFLYIWRRRTRLRREGSDKS